MKVPARALVLSLFALAGLVLGYAVVFGSYAAGLLGDGSRVPAVHWERTLKGTILLGPFLGAFLLLGALAWREKWRSGVLPWGFGAAAVVVLARLDAGILKTLDILWLVIALGLVYLMSREEPEEGSS